MVRVLLDTCILSELQKSHPDERVVNALRNIEARDTFVSVISYGEIQRGTSVLPLSKKRSALESWLTTLERRYEGRLVSVNLDISRIWGELSAKARSRGLQVSATDGLIAATAIQHGLHVVTRNTRHFEPTGAMLINPWEAPE